ncbi:MAG: SDR family oxidoreductase [Bacteroidetes bacterium]|nr:SDR family oxidoreductase [Bacteroidota bacterium]MBU1719581.1 SDR family oxidoreductase [Bacteroidota bacterium]
MNTTANKWALIMGGSSGFGLATAKKLADDGFSVFILHRDRKAKEARVEEQFAIVRKSAPAFHALNTNALDESLFPEIIKELTEVCGPKNISLFLFSIADGNLRSILDKPEQTGLSSEDFSRTIWAMGSSYTIWTKLLFQSELLSTDSRIVGITSEGTTHVLESYAAVAAAKSVMESSTRYLAIELAPFRITVNLINAGITPTPALRVFPRFAKLMEQTEKRNPSGRLTEPEDVANAVSLIARPESSWITGNIIRVDGGEQIVSNI